MADLVISGVLTPTEATNETRHMWVGSDLVVRLRIANEPIPQTAQPSDLLTRSDFSEISYAVYREVAGVDSLVEDYESVSVNINDAISATLPIEWGKDGVGYNFRHVVPAAAFAANALHRVIFRFVSGGVTTRHPVAIYVDGPNSETATAGSGEITGAPGPQGEPGEDGYRPTFDVTRDEYGAVGDGVTDDRTAINAAIAAAEVVGGGAVVFFPAEKTFSVAGYIEVNDTGDVLLSGYGAVIKQAVGSGNQLLFIGKDNVTVEGLTIDGNYPTVKGPTTMSGTARAGGASTIKLALAASSSNNAYNGLVIEITGNTGSGQVRTISTYTGADRDATIYGTWDTEPDNTSTYAIYTGDGIGVNVLADNVTLRDVLARNTKGEGIAAQTGSGEVTLINCQSKNTGLGGMHVKGDVVRYRGCKVYDWNARSLLTGIRGIEFDAQECDAESLEIIDTYLELNEDTRFTDGILIDCGDNDLTDGDSVRTPFGNSGQATNDGGYAAFTLDAGHGFKVGDSVWLDDSGETQYDGPASTGKSHVILAIKGTGNVYARYVSDTTLTLHHSPAEARSGSNAVDITGAGTGTTYITAIRSGRNTISSVDASTNVITTTSAHGFITGMMVRLTRGETDTAMPGGLANAGTIVLNTAYTNPGSGATYMRPKRVRNVTLRNVTVNWHSSDSADTNGIKINNAENVQLDRVIVNDPPVYTGDTASSVRLGQGLRKVSMTDCSLSGTLTNNVLAIIPELIIDRCEIGGWARPENAITTLAARKMSLTNSTLRFGFAAIDVGGVESIRDSDIEQWVITDNILEGESSSRCRVFDIGDISQLVNSGKIVYARNERRNVGTYPGLSISSVNTGSDVITMSTFHQLETGDKVEMVSSDPPLGSADNTEYFIRKTGNTTLKLYTTKADAFADTNAVDLSDAGSGSTLWSHKIGVQFSNNGNRDFLFDQKDDSGKSFFALAVPSGTTIAYNVGDIVWAMHPADGEPPGWLCTAPGTPTSTVGTFVALAELGTLKV